MNEPRRIAEVLLSEGRWRVICHVKPDGDTLGCASALVSAGKYLGKDVVWCGADPVPPVYAFLPWASEYLTVDAVPDDDRCEIAVDISTRDRGVPGARPRVSIDHHESDELLGSEVNWVDPGAAAAGELIYRVILALGCPLDGDIATALYVALSTDTGGFKYSNTTADTLRIASELVRAGASPVAIDEKLHFNDTPAKVRLWGRCMSRCERVGKRSMLSWLTHDDFVQTGAAESDTEGLVNVLTHVAGTDMTVLVSEVDGCLRCSFRARGDVSAKEIAERHGGGGHQYAAGAKLRIPLEEGVRTLREELKRV